jgi:hypothetical protein
MAGAGFHSFAKLCAQMCTADSGNTAVFTLQVATNKITTLHANCHSQYSKFESCWPHVTLGNLQVHLGAVYQRFISVVANRGIGARSLAREWIPVPAI